MAEDFGLVINEKKSTVFTIKGYLKLGEVKTISKIPVVGEYCYVGLITDNRGSIDPHICKLKKRVAYLTSTLGYYSHALSFQNQYLLWQIFIRLNLLYLAPIIHT